MRYTEARSEHCTRPPIPCAICSADIGHGPGLYALALDGEREYLTCERCADFRAVDPRMLDLARELIRRSFGYRASFRHFPIVGLCDACQRELADAEVAA